MNDSSQDQTYTITLNDTETTNVSDIVINWDTSSISSLTTADINTLTIPSLTGPYSSIDTIDLGTIGAFMDFYKDEFDGRFPDYDRVQKMCEDYPGLEIAYRKFKEIYKMVKEDYDGKERARKEYK